MDSFNQAKSCSKGYRLFFPERDPRQFHLVPPGMCLRKRSTSSKHDSCEGSSSGAKRQKQGQAFADQSEQPLQVSSEGVTSKSKRLGKTSANTRLSGGRVWTSQYTGHLHTAPSFCRAHGDVAHGGPREFVSSQYYFPQHCMSNRLSVGPGLFTGLIIFY
jgi:hypothetical protein